MDNFIHTLESLGLPVYDTDATGASLKLEDLPYLLVFGSEGDPSGEWTLDDVGVADEVTVRHVGASAEQVRLAAQRTRLLISHARIGGRSYGLEEVRAPVADSSVSLPGSSRHPVFLDVVWRAWE